MAIYANGKIIDQNLIFSEAQTLPNNTSVNSTNVVYFGGAKSGKLQVNVVAATAISIANNKVLTVNIEYGTTSTPTDKLNDVIYTETAGVGKIAYAAGDTICQYTIPADKAAAYSYAELVYTTTDDESSEKVDAFIAIIT